MTIGAILLATQLCAAAETKPLGEWPLTSDTKASTGGADAAAHGIKFTGEAAVFDGKTSALTLPAPLNHVGQGDFTLALDVNASTDHKDVLGDLVSKFDPATRTGFTLGFLDFPGVTSTQSNFRNLYFGVDANTPTSEWIDCGRPGNAKMVWALCVYDDDLYAGTFEWDENEAGHVWRYAGNGTWEDCGSPDNSNSVTALAVFDGQLYAATAKYRSQGSAMEPSPNENFGGSVYVYEKNAGTWRHCGKIDDIEAVFGLVVYDGKLYASSMYSPGLYQYEGGTSWKSCGHAGGRVVALSVYNGHLYATGYDEGRSGVYRYDGGENWTDCGTPLDTTQTYSFVYYRDAMHVGTWPGGVVFRYENDQWVSTGRLGEELEVMAMANYNGALYAGTLPLAEVYRYDQDVWTRVGRVDHTPDVKYRRAWSMAVYDGKLFCGTLPSGQVWSYEAGKMVTHDTAMPGGWHHIAAVRASQELKLYLDGKLVGSSSIPKSLIDLSNDAPFEIGFGPTAHYNGQLRNLRVYDRGLDTAEIAALANK